MSREPGWGPTARGGRGRRWPARLALGLAAALVAVAAASLTSAAQVVRQFERDRETVAIDELQEVQQVEDPSEPLDVLLVGTDGRDELTREQQRDLTLGEFDGERADTNLLVSISADRSTINVVSVPRDTAVLVPGREPLKLSQTLLDGGEEGYVDAVADQLGFPVNHYVEVSITGFLSTVDAVGGVEVCLDEPLVDVKSGADFEAGCRLMDGTDALAYVRSRQGDTGDYQRIERQQDFLRSLASQVVDASLLLQPGRLREVGEKVTDAVVTDDGLDVQTGIRLAQDLQQLVAGGLPTVTVPGYPRRLATSIGTQDFIVAYQPGLEAITEALEAGEPLASRGTPEQREEVDVQMWVDDDYAGAEIVSSTLFYGGFQPVGTVASDVTAGARTVVRSLPGFEEEAGWVAAHLGADVRSLPSSVAEEVAEGVQVVVAVGDDAATPEDLLPYVVPE